MNHCLPEGEMRAWLDRELPPETIAEIAAHLEECALCASLRDELERRAARVSGLMAALDAPVPASVRRPGRRRAAAMLAMAASIAAAALLLPRTPPAPPSAPPPEAYLRLDNEPLDAGLIVRVALGPKQVPADVLFDARGRARAIRFVE
jgi:anti-sigma factor RsiW